jgi:ATP/maltotriose-dependent transcriptional regulator MalT
MDTASLSPARTPRETAADAATGHDPVEAVRALYRQGALRQALGLATQLLGDHRCPPEQFAGLQVLLASLLFARGHFAAAMRATLRVLGVPGASADDFAEAEVIGLLVCEAQDRVPELRARAADILAGKAAQTDDGLAGALSAFGWIAWHEGRVATAVGLLEAAVERSEAGPSARRRTHPQLVLARMCIALGEDDHAAAWIDRARQDIDSAGHVDWSVAASIYGARRHLAAGRLDDAAGAAREGVASALRLGTSFLLPLASATLKAVDIACGEPARAAARSSWDATADAESINVGVGIGLCALMNARICAMRGDAKRGVAAAHDIYDNANAHKGLLIEEPAAASDLVRLALTAGEPARAAAIVSCATQLARDNAAFVSVVASGQHARGLFHGDVALLERAATLHRQPLARVAALLDLARALLDRGEYAVAQSLYERAATMFTQMGAGSAARSVRSRASVGPACRKNRCDVAGSAVGCRSLTKIERGIAELATTGLSNRQIGERVYLSRHTVDFHLRRVYRKLDISSRVQLTRLLAHANTGEPA